MEKMTLEQHGKIGELLKQRTSYQKQLENLQGDKLLVIENRDGLHLGTIRDQGAMQVLDTYFRERIAGVEAALGNMGLDLTSLENAPCPC